ncbi:MAG: hypothetical protein FRX49_07728 [Trebouxia sp. A1-2]|nr:MAG: hypothetical protein FRX49_07728 [Trebouxia sp. A1-2]
MAPVQQIKLWELAGEDSQISISPYVWRVRLLLAYKGQSYESIPWRFMEKDVIKPFEKVPVLEFNGKKIGDSADISKFLETQFPEPPVFKTNCQTGDVGLDFILAWANSSFVMTAFPVVLMDIVSHLAKTDQKYFRESREKMFGATLEDFSADKPAKLAAFQSALEPLRQTLKQSKFLGGNKLNYADIAVAGNFLWLKSISKTQLLERDDPVYEWRERIFKQFEDTISKAHTYPV